MPISHIINYYLMQITKKSLPKNQLELTIELSAEEMKPYVENAAKEISMTKKIPGFRPGHAPLNLIIKEFGEMKILQTAANNAIAATYYDILETEKLETVDQPDIKMLKLAPNNPLIYSATVALMPQVTLCDYEKIKIKPLENIKIEQKEIDKVISELQRLRAKEILEDKEIANGDKVELDFDTFIDNVLLENGQARKHSLIVGENTMIPGFEDNLIGQKKNDEKEFKLFFPKNYHAANLAGKEAKFKIKIIAVYKIELPELNDEFAKSMGLQKIDDLRKNIENNIKLEKEIKNKQAQELEIMEKLNDKCQFNELPDVLINNETHKMMHELEENLDRRGLKLPDYLKHLKKTEAEMRLDFTADAIKRVKSALAIRAVAQKENISVSDEDINIEINKTLASYKMHPAYAGQIADLEKSMKTENARHYFKNLLMNRKAIECIKEKMMKKNN